MIKDFRYVHLKTDWSLPSTRANVTSGENIAVSMGKLAKWYNDFKPWVFANPTRNDLVPVTSKTYTNIIATANNQAKGTFYFGKLVPTTFDTPWHIKYRVRVYVPSHLEYYQSAIVDYYGHRDDRNPEYHLVNSIRDTASRSAYYHTFYRAKEAGITGGYGHLIGESLVSSTNQTNTDYKRTFEIDILATHGCTFTFFDNVLLYENVPGTGTTNYNALANYSFTTVGFLPDSNTYDRTVLNEVPIAGTNGVKQHSLVAYNSVGKLESFTTSSGTGMSKSFYTTGKFITDPVIMYYAGSTNIASGAVISGTALFPECSGIDMRYSSNVTSSVGFAKNKIVYLEIEFDSDGYWHPTANGFVQEGAFVSGKYYIHMGVAPAVYQISMGDQHPILYWDGTKFISRDDHDYAKSDHTHGVFTTTTNGFVPAPTSSNTGKFLKGDGTWATPSSTDTKVTQAYSTTNNSYPLLATATAGITSTSSRGDTTAILNNRAYLNPSNGILSAGGIIVEQNSDTEARAIRITSDSFSFGLHIGVSGTNHGIYDFKLSDGSGSWVLYSNDATNVKQYHLNGTAAALGTAPGTRLSVGSTSQPVYFSNGVPVECSSTFGVYAAGTGLSLSGNTFNHSNSVTAKTTQGLYPIAYDAQGHITASGTAVTTLKNPNSLTLKYNTSTAWTYDGSAAKTITIKAGTNVTVTGDTSGNITIAATDTTYTGTSPISVSGTTISIANASTSAKGAVQLSSAVDSTSTSLAATPSAVKSAYDLAASKSTVAFSRSLTSGTKIGTITIDGTATDIYCQTNTNTDTKVNVVTRGTTKAYLLATTTTPTSTAQAVTSVAETGVYLDTTAGKLVATSFSGNGSALTNLNASNLASGTVPLARIPTGTTSSTVALGNHAHNYAGSASAGGPANEADTAKATVYEGGTGDGSVVTDIVWTTQVSSTGYKDLSINDGLQYHTRAGSTTKEGFSKVVIGNNTTLGEDNNKSGGIIIYGCTTTSTSIVPPAGGFASNRTLTLPDASGTICLTSHTHNYAGSSSAGGAANSVANKLSVYYNTTKAYDYDGSAAKSLTIKAGTNVTITGNANGEITIASSYTNTDTKVTQAYSTTNSSYPLLMTATAGNTSTSSRGDTTSILNNRLYANPSSGTVYAGGIIVTQASDTEARAIRLESPAFNLGLHIGAGGTNHGIYDFNKVSGSSTGDWIIYSNDATNTKDYHLKGSAAAIGTAPGTLTSKGSATNPVYFSSGVPVACTYSLNKTVPSDAVFTDTKVTQNNSTTSAEYRVLLSHGANNTNETDIAYKSGNLTFNPSTRILTGGKYVATWTSYPNQFTQLDGDGLRIAHGDTGSWAKGISFYTNTDMSSADCVIGYCRSSSGAASSYAYFGNSSSDTWFQVADHGYARLYGDRLYISNNPDAVKAHLYGKDSSKTAFPLIGYNATNVWIGANASVGYHHAGGTYISTGYAATSDTDSTNARNSILVSVPESVSPTASSGDNKDVYNWEVMHAGCNRYVGHCTTATATAAKTVTTSDGHFKRVVGSIISVVFDNAVNAACTLDIDGTGAYSVLVSNSTSISRTIISASEAAIFQVSDSYYIFLGCSTAGSHCVQTLATASSYTYWRPLLVGNSSGQYISTNFSSSKGVTYAFNNIRCKPSTGTVAASTFVSTSQALLFSGTYSSSQSVTISVTSLFVLYSNVIAVIVTKSYGTINCVLPLAYIKAQGTSGLYEIGAATTTNTTYHLSAIYSNDNTLLITNGTMPSTNGIMSIKLIAM